MKQHKKHRYVQPEGDKYCVLYNIANIFSVDLPFLDGYRSEGIGTKDTEYIIQNIGFPKSYIAVMSNVTHPHRVPEGSFKFVIDSVRAYSKPNEFMVLPTVIRAKNNRLHLITILINQNSIIISDPRKTHMVEVTMEELLKVVPPKCVQISIVLTYKGFRKTTATYITI